MIAKDVKNQLESQMSMEELSQAVKQSQNNRTPEADAIPVNFYKVFWKLLASPS